MPVVLKIDRKKDLAVFTATGTLHADDIMGVMEEFYAGKITTYAVWDCMEADVYEISGQDVEKMAGFSPRFQENRAGAKTAIVSSDQMTDALSELFILFGNASQIPVEVKLFKARKQAMNWLFPPTDV